ncbi:hypothetical protein QN277_003857 [Acacia crassicarpa]|uniref:Uncharacterized protein n=1 Tax=Acacia crassicarpa TaxID=499986 RepID=A0AAE1MD14_9FABA|nr:hypothetical protein QN277_003857 [Acacia crassicarpa]
MLGTGIQFGRARGEDRFYDSVKARRSVHSLESDRPRKAHSDVTASRPSHLVNERAVDSVNREPENRVGSEETKKPAAVPSTPKHALKPLSNLNRFLLAITPSVPAQYPSKTAMRGLGTYGGEFRPYFILGDLWESFREWSAYGAGVPVLLNDNDSVVQYYVPYLSGIQIYADTPKPSAKSRQLGEDSDSDFRDSSSDGSSDYEPARGLKYMEEERNLGLSDDVHHWMGGLSLRDQPNVTQDGFSSDDGESVNSKGCLIFEYLERDPPFSREPLADKIFDLAFRFPELMTLRSCDMLSSSWISVAWYPIYRIPTGPTLKDLDACFLTYHFLRTPMEGVQRSQAPLPYLDEIDGGLKLSLTVFGLASYKFKGSLWTPNGGDERQSASSLLESADKWLRDLKYLLGPCK